jgi:putative copper resistance protein D
VITPLTALAIDRLCFDASAIAIYGRSSFLIGAASGPLRQALEAWCRRWTSIACLVALAAALAWLPLEAATSGEDWHAVVDGETLRSLLFDTGTGEAWLVRVALAAVLLVVLVGWRFALKLQFAASALLLASLALSGHARVDSGLRGLLHIMNDTVHLLSGGAWLGGLLMLPQCLKRLSVPPLIADARTALARYSSAGHLAVALVVATGVLNAVLIVPAESINIRSTYQVLLTIKICLVAMMIGLALVNRYVLVPRIRLRRAQSISQIRMATFLEIALGFGVITLVAIFGSLDPK